MNNYHHVELNFRIKINLYLVCLVDGACQIRRQIYLEGKLQRIAEFASFFAVSEPLDVDANNYWDLLQ